MTRGGARPSSGRPTKFASGPMRKVSLALSEPMIAMLSDIGGGSVVHGLHTVLARMLKRRARRGG